MVLEQSFQANKPAINSSVNKEKIHFDFMVLWHLEALIEKNCSGDTSKCY